MTSLSILDTEISWSQLGENYLCLSVNLFIVLPVVLGPIPDKWIMHTLGTCIYCYYQ